MVYLLKDLKNHSFNEAKKFSNKVSSALLNHFDCPLVFSVICGDLVVRVLTLVSILKSTVAP